MSRYSGLNFPFIFDASRRTSNKVADIEKVRARINLLIRQQLRLLLFRPDVGTDWESILFADDIQVTQDFIYSFISDAIVSDFDGDLTINSVVCEKEGTRLNVKIGFHYAVGDVDFSVNIPIGGAIYG